MRAPAAPVHTYSESHSDDVTSLSFHPSSSHSEILLSGSTDGLLCTYDTRIADEDDAVLSVGNTGASLARAGWGAARAGAGAGAATPGPDAAERRGLGGAWAVSDMQTLSVWDADAVSAQREFWLAGKEAADLSGFSPFSLCRAV